MFSEDFAFGPFSSVGTSLFLSLLWALTCSSNAAIAQTCPQSFSTYNPAAVYSLSDITKPLSNNSQISRISPLEFFYVLKRNGGSPLGGAISIKRIYFLTHPVGDDSEIGIWKNVPKDLPEQSAGLDSYKIYHQSMADDDPTFREGLHVEYVDGTGRSDDSSAKRSTFLPGTSKTSWRCPTSDGDSFLCKAMVLRYSGVDQNGSCLDFKLFTKDEKENELIGSVSNVYLEVYELDTDIGPTKTFSAKFNLK